MGPERWSQWQRGMLKLQRPKVAATVLAVMVMVNGSLVAVGTGALPAPAQRLASEVLGFVGIKVPYPNGGPHPLNRGSPLSPSDAHDGAAPASRESSVSPSPPSTLGSRPRAPTTVASPAVTRPQPPAGWAEWGTGAPGGVTRSSGTTRGSGYHPEGAASNGGRVGLRGQSGNNGNAWGHASKAAGPPGQSGNNGNAWSHANKSS